MAAIALAIAAFVFADFANAAPADAGGGFSIRWVPDPAYPNRAAAVVSGMDRAVLAELQKSEWTPGQWQSLFSLYAEQGDMRADLNLPAMIGSYEFKSGELWFHPQFPLESGVKYRAVFRADRLPGKSGAAGALNTSLFQLPARSKERVTAISEVYPTSKVIPENLLKFYLHFSAPMSRGHIYDYVHLRDDHGKNVDLPFLEIGEELWDPTMTRLTLFIDPGRIKRGVKPLEDIGPSLSAGRRFIFVIDGAWQDANGIPLKAGFERTYDVSPPDREPLDPAVWKMDVPKAATRDPLRLSFPKPMDHALAERVIQVTDPSGNLIDGKTVLQDAERSWLFTPDQPWKSQAYRVVIQLTLEDLAGNNIGKPFEVDLFNGVQRRLTGSSVKLGFQIQ